MNLMILTEKNTGTEGRHFMAEHPTPQRGFYDVNGEKLPRVTTVLNVLAKPGLEKWKHRIGLTEANRISRESSELGTRVHAALERVNRGETFDPDDETAPYVAPYREWLEANVRDVLMIEQFLVNQRDGYAGTADLVARMKDHRVMLIDLKTSNSIDGTYRLQTAAYLDALHDMDHDVHGRLIVNTPSRQPGVLKTVEFDDYDRDLRAWKACLRLFRWNERHKDAWRNY